MWCYRRPGFEALLVTELQKQQRCSQFCDTLLKAEGVSVPAHSCILSAFNSQFSSVLSSTPAPPAGQSRVLEFQALGARTLLHMMRLLYSGEMVGEGEQERQEAISTAAKLGIHGLVEVPKKVYQVRNGEMGGQYMDVGVQTDSLLPEESGAGRGKWRRQVRDGCTLLWKDTLPKGEKDAWTQTDEVQGSTAQVIDPVGSFESINMTAFESFGHSELHFVPAHVPHVPIAVIHTHNENQTSALQSLSSVPTAAVGESMAAGCRSFVLGQPSSSVPPSFAVSHVSAADSSQALLCAGDRQSWWADPQEAGTHVAGETKDEEYEQFQGNIPGFITYFLNPDKEKGSRRGRAGRRRGAGVVRARRASRGARRPRGKTGGRGMGVTQTVDVQNVGVSVFHRKWVQRWTVQALRTGQGAGAIGRKLYPKTRELLTSHKSCQNRRMHGKVWEVGESGEVLLQRKRGRGNAQRGKTTNAAEQQDGLRVGRGRRARANTSAASVSCVPTLRTLYNSHTSDSQLTQQIQPSTSVSVFSPPTNYVTPSSGLLHTTHLPHVTPPPNENRQTFDSLLEEVLMGLDINASAPRRHPPPAAGGSSCNYSSPGCSNHQEHCSREVVTVGKEGTGFSSANSEVQQQGEGQISDILDHFLQSFEQHIEICNSREEVVTHWQSSTEDSQLQPVLSKSQTPHPESTFQQTQAPSVCARPPREIRCPQTSPQAVSVSTVLPFSHSDDHSPEQPTIPRLPEPLDNDDMSPETALSRSQTVPAQSTITHKQAEAPPKARELNSRQTTCVKSVEEKRTCVRNPVSSKDPITKITNDPENEQLQQMSGGKLHNEPAQDAQVTLQSPVKENGSSSSVTCPHDTETIQHLVSHMKTYPFRSKINIVQILPHSGITSLCQPVHSSQDVSTQLAQPTKIHNHSLKEKNTECKLKKPGRPPKNGHLYLSVSESLVVPIQQQPVESCNADKQGTNRKRHKKQEKNQERCEEQEKNQERHKELEKNLKRCEEQEKNQERYKEQKKNQQTHEVQEKDPEICEEQEKNQEMAEEQDKTLERHEEQEKIPEIYEEEQKNQETHKEQEKKQEMAEEQDKILERHEEQEKNQERHEAQRKNKDIHEEEQDENQEGAEEQENTQETGELKPEKSQRRCEELTVLSQEPPKGSTRMGRKRPNESVKERSTDPTMFKRICIEPVSQPAIEVSATCVCGFVSETASLTGEDIDVESVDVEANEGDVSQRGGDLKEEGKGYLTGEDLETSGDEIIDVDGDWDWDDDSVKNEDDSIQISSSRETEAAAAHCGEVNFLVSQREGLSSLGSLKEESEEYIDVIGGAGPIPDLAHMSWTDCSVCEEEEGEEEIDVVGQAMDYASSTLVLFSRL